jgi:membrane protein DedA with SNARE-associated domain
LVEQLIETYGYWAVGLGTMLEGETIVILATLAAHRGYLDVQWVVGLAFCGALIGDQLVFHVGRWRGEWVIAHWPRISRQVERAQDLSHRHSRWLGLVFRMTYGLRTVVPILWGMGGMSTIRFLVLDVLAISVWLGVVVSVSWFLGRMAREILGEAARYEMVILGSVVLGAITIWGVRRLREGSSTSSPVDH